MGFTHGTEHLRTCKHKDRDIHPEDSPVTVLRRLMSMLTYFL